MKTRGTSTRSTRIMMPWPCTRRCPIIKRGPTSRPVSRRPLVCLLVFVARRGLARRAYGRGDRAERLAAARRRRDQSNAGRRRRRVAEGGQVHGRRLHGLVLSPVLVSPVVDVVDGVKGYRELRGTDLILSLDFRFPRRETSQVVVHGRGARISPSERVDEAYLVAVSSFASRKAVC